MSVYLDHAATTPIRPEARLAIAAEWEHTGNPASIHGSGQSAKNRMETARETLAGVFGCDPVEVIVTSGGTEAVNTAVKGFYWNRNPDGRRPVIIVPAGEHHATLDSASWLEALNGAEVEYVQLTAEGRVAASTVEDALERHRGRVALVTMLWVNNEVGTISDIDAVSRVCVKHGVPLHVDAVAAVHEELRFAQRRLATASGRGAGLVAVSVSAHKLGGPVGVGALVLAREVAPEALLHGGGQQRQRRSGTQDVAAAAGFAAAAVAAATDRENEAARLRVLRDRVIDGVRDRVPGVRVNGVAGAVDRERPDASCAIVHLSFSGCEADSLLFLLDMAGVQVSTGSACQAGVPEPSHVLRAMGRSDPETRGALRVSLGWTSTEVDVEAFLQALPDAVRRATAAGLSDRLVDGGSR